MQRQRFVTAVCAVPLALALTACATGTPTASVPHKEPVFERSAPVPDPPGSRPLAGQCETTYNPPPLPPPAVHRQIDAGACQLAHLGRAEFHSVKDIDFINGTQITHEATFTAANGDVLRAQGTGRSAPGSPGRIGFTATLTVIGGTGRFADATGEMQVEGEAVLASSTAAFELNGWVAYDASGRSRR